MKKWFLLALATACFLIQRPSFAQSAPNGTDSPGVRQHFKAHHERKGPFSKLGLTDDQKNKMKSMMSQLRQSLEPLRIEEKKKRLELAEIYLNPNPDRQAVEQKLQEMNGLRGQKQEILTDTHFKILSILNPEQKQKFAQWTAGRLSGDEGSHHRGHSFGHERDRS